MTSSSETKTCESCGNSFGCGAKADGCWCVDVTLDQRIADELKLRFQDCLCPACLNLLASRPSMIVTFADGATEMIAGATRVDTTNYHEGMFDFYDERGTLLKQISMSADIEWKSIDPAGSKDKI